MYIVINLLHKFVTCFSVTPKTYKFRYFVGNLLKETQEKKSHFTTHFITNRSHIYSNVPKTKTSL